MDGHCPPHLLWAGRDYLVNHTFYMVPNCPGDVNGDCQMNIFDLAAVGLAYGSRSGDSNWNPRRI